jgi:hypothetical protein
MTYEDEQRLLADNLAMKKQLETLTNSLKAMTSTEPVKVAWGNESLRVNLEDVASGKVIVEQKEPEPVQLKECQISKNDPNLGKHLADIAAGKLEVV